MARPVKKGIDYYQADVDMIRDRKIRKLIRRTDGLSYAVFHVVLSEIYHDKGYYVTYDDDLCFDVSDYLNCDEEKVKEIIEECINVGLFDQEKAQKYGVLTSAAIQKRWIRIVTAAKRSDTKVDETINLVEEEETESEIVSYGRNHSATELLPEETISNKNHHEFSPEKTTVSYSESTQSKVKESKDNTHTNTRARVRDGPEIQDVREPPFDHSKPIKFEFPSFEKFKNQADVLAFHPEFTQHLFDKAESRDWKDGSGQVISNWTAWLRAQSHWQDKFLTQHKTQHANAQKPYSSGKTRGDIQVEQLRTFDGFPD